VDGQALGDLAKAGKREARFELRLAEEDEAQVTPETAGAELVEVFERGEGRVRKAVAFVEAEGDRGG
jgi:hypothetical protein